MLFLDLADELGAFRETPSSVLPSGGGSDLLLLARRVESRGGNQCARWEPGKGKEAHTEYSSLSPFIFQYTR